MKKIIDYKVILVTASVNQTDSLIDYRYEYSKEMCEKQEELQNIVMEFIKKGYQPFGNFSLTFNAPGYPFYLTQAVVKYE